MEKCAGQKDFSSYFYILAQTLWSNSNIGIIVFNKEDIAIAYNKTASVLFKEEIMGVSLDRLSKNIIYEDFSLNYPINSFITKSHIEGINNSSCYKDSEKYREPIDLKFFTQNNIHTCKINGRPMVVHKLHINDFIDNQAVSSEQPGKIFLFLDNSREDNLQKELTNLHLILQQMEKVFDASFDEFYITDGEGKTLKVSKAAYERLYGENPDSLIGKNVKDLEAMGKFEPSVFPRIKKEKKTITFIQRTSQGRQMLVTSTPIFDEHNQIMMVVSNSRDLTELLRIKKKLEDVQSTVKKYEEEIEVLREEQLQIDGVIAASQKMKQVLYTATKAARTDSNVLILGPTGVGKGVIAKIIHKKSSRAKGPFMKINCAAIPENLIEAELFGYEGGAFTSARKEGKVGLIELANEGTLFLDEIAEMPFPLQAKLLDVLQEKKFMRVGGTKQIKLNARIISATNRDLVEMVKKGSFRRDLYYRLNVIPVEIPPLKERPEDIIQLTNHFFKKYSTTLPGKSFTSDAIDALLSYGWPGNVRELENIIERLVVMVDSQVIGVDSLPVHIQRDYKGEKKYLYPSEQKGQSFDWNLNKSMEKLEEMHLRKAFHRFRSSRKIAKALGISQSSVIRKLQKYGIGSGENKNNRV
ncbi:MAG: sigma-54 interaction domain-containing protein [Dethiobacteria bacterium]